MATQKLVLFRISPIATVAAFDGAFWPADECPLLGVKRTSPGNLRMSAYDPKRTYDAFGAGENSAISLS